MRRRCGIGRKADRRRAGSRKLLEEHFGIEAPEPGEVRGSGAAAAKDLSQPQGEVVGPVTADKGATYFIYVPKSLKEGRLAPLLFYTNSSGGGGGMIKGLAEGAETCGWVVAISVESKNNQALQENLRVSEAAVKHILGSLPVDPERVHFTGNSGGGATAMANADRLKAAGGMPNIAYIPDGFDPPKGHYYALGGGRDYNRYSTAHIARKYGKDGFHCMNPGGHGGTEDWHRIDGMIWLNLRWLAGNARGHADEVLDFEASMIGWIRDKQESEPHRAYSNALLLKEGLRVSAANAPILDGLISALGGEEKNRLYHEGLVLIDKISEDAFADLAGGSQFGHTCEKAVKMVEREVDRFRDVPEVFETLKAMAEPTVGR